MLSSRTYAPQRSDALSSTGSRTTSHRSQNMQEPQSSTTTFANWNCEHVVVGAGVAIFHLRTERVVLCYHTREHYWFLPKGRKDANESIEVAACREGYEESGYRNRLLPLPIPHRQPQVHAANTTQNTPYSTEPLWTQLMPVRPTVQYMLFWFIAETLSPDDEDKVTTASSHPVTSHSNQVDLSIMLESREATTALYPAPTYTTPPMFPANLTLQKRMELEPEGYEPTRHENTGVDDEEAQYTSKLVSIATAKELLGGSIMADVVKRGWDLIQLRLNMEGLGAEFEA